MKFTVPNFSVEAIAESGQCFRWLKKSSGEFRIVAFGRVLRIRQDPATGEVWTDAERDEFYNVWSDYFDIKTDYGKIIDSIPEDDAYLKEAAVCGRGIRILRQDSWETLISFIISQRKNIPAIRLAVERLAEAAGHIIGRDEGKPVYSFPSLREISKLSLEDLLNCGLGYRAKYIYETARRFGENGWPDKEYAKMDDAALEKALCGIYGVGPKIALCTMLFGFHRLNAFPMDVWMHRVEERRYPNGIPAEKYAPWAGVMQQYMFAYEREHGQ